MFNSLQKHEQMFKLSTCQMRDFVLFHSVDPLRLNAIPIIENVIWEITFRKKGLCTNNFTLLFNHTLSFELFII